MLVGSSGLEPPTSRLSGARSNQLSYEPILLGTLTAFPISFPFSQSFHSQFRVTSMFLGRTHCVLVEMMGFEPLTPCLQGRCSPS